MQCSIINELMQYMDLATQPFMYRVSSPYLSSIDTFFCHWCLSLYASLSLIFICAISTIPSLFLNIVTLVQSEQTAHPALAKTLARSMWAAFLLWPH